MRHWTATLFTFAAVLAAGGPRVTLAQGLVWAAAHERSGDAIEAFDASGARVRTFTPAGGAAAGIAVVGNVVYYAAGTSIYKMDAATGAGLGVITTSLSFGMQTLAWDGANFWTADADPRGSNQLFRIGTDGVVNKTVRLANVYSRAFSFPNYLEYFGGRVIANRGGPDPTLDVYDLDGNTLQPSFFTAYGPVAFDGTNFLAVRGYRLDMSGVDVDVRSGITGAVVGRRTLPAPYGSYSDFSFDYAGRADIVATPELGSAALAAAGLGVLALAGAGRRRRRA